MPRKVIIAIDPNVEMIQIVPENKMSEGTLSIVDDKKRIVLPKWVRDEIGEVKDMLLIVDGDKHYLSPKTGKIL